MKARQVVVFLLVIAALAATAFTAAGHGLQIRELFHGPRARALSIALFTLAVANASIAFVFAKLVLSESDTESTTETVATFLISQLAKYIPGRLWSLLAQGALLARIPPARIVSVNVQMTIANALLVSGCGFAFAAGPAHYALTALILGATWVLALLTLRTGFPLRQLGRVRFLVRWLGPVADRRSPQQVSLRAVGAGFALYLACYCAGWWSLVQAAAPGSDTARLMSAFSLAYLAGLVSLLPAGIGAREGSLMLLAPVLGVARPEMAAVAVASRAAMVVVDIGLAALGAGLLLFSRAR